MARFLIAGNWKMNGSKAMTVELLAGISAGLSDENVADVDVLVCPPAAYLLIANDALIDSAIKLGAQTVSEHANGAYTGEISASMLQDIACEYVLVGHSERRSYFKESDQDVANKFSACISAGLIPILCVGETLQERENGSTEAVIDRQIDAALEKAGIAGFEHAVIAYEPVWAIGTGMTATPEQAQQVHAFIRQKLAALDSSVAADIKILYGGSMKADNAKELLLQNDINGGLIGGASLKADDFVAIYQQAASVA